MTFNPLIYTDEYLRVRAIPTRHTSTYIFCHGRDQVGDQWQGLVEPLRKLGQCDHIAFIFPYFEFTTIKNDSDMTKAASRVQKIVSEEILKGIPAYRIAVGGFDEGLELALLATVGDNNKIAGTMGIAQGFEYIHTIVANKKAANAETPIFLISHAAKSSHGILDETLAVIGQPIGALVHGIKPLNNEGQSVSSKDMNDLASFLHDVLPVDVQHIE